MQPLIWDRRPDGLRAPAMVCAFQGWNDAGDAASSAVSFLASKLGARRFASIDPEEFYDFQANRPCIRFGENEKREISWPTVEIFEAAAPRAPRDLGLVQGVGPSPRRRPAPPCAGDGGSSVRQKRGPRDWWASSPPPAPTRASLRRACGRPCPT